MKFFKQLSAAAVFAFALAEATTPLALPTRTRTTLAMKTWTNPKATHSTTVSEAYLHKCLLSYVDCVADCPPFPNPKEACSRICTMIHQSCLEHVDHELPTIGSSTTGSATVSTMS